MNDPPPDVEAFLADLPDEARPALLALRETIASVVPDAEERIGYGVPAFYYKKRPLVSYGATANHCAFYVQDPEVIEAHRAELEGYDLAKGTIRFQPARPIPTEVVERLVRARMARIDAA
jgi:uncharacterized protein YdhG (YjbR/CyaY superfamily)